MMTQVTWTNPETGKELRVFVCGEKVGRNGNTYLLVTKVEGSPHIFSVRPEHVVGGDA